MFLLLLQLAIFEVCHHLPPLHLLMVLAIVVEGLLLLWLTIAHHCLVNIDLEILVLIMVFSLLQLVINHHRLCDFHYIVVLFVVMVFFVATINNCPPLILWSYSSLWSSHCYNQQLHIIVLLILMILWCCCHRDCCIVELVIAHDCLVNWGGGGELKVKFKVERCTFQS